MYDILVVGDFMQLFKYLKEPSQTQRIKKEFLSPWDITEKNTNQEEIAIAELSTGPNCLKR